MEGRGNLEWWRARSLPVRASAGHSKGCLHAGPGTSIACKHPHPRIPRSSATPRGWRVRRPSSTLIRPLQGRMNGGGSETRGRRPASAGLAHGYSRPALQAASGYGAEAARSVANLLRSAGSAICAITVSAVMVVHVFRRGGDDSRTPNRAPSSRGDGAPREEKKGGARPTLRVFGFEFVSEFSWKESK